MITTNEQLKRINLISRVAGNIMSGDMHMPVKEAVNLATLIVDKVTAQETK